MIGSHANLPPCAVPAIPDRRRPGPLGLARQGLPQQFEMGAVHGRQLLRRSPGPGPEILSGGSSGRVEWQPAALDEPGRQLLASSDELPVRRWVGAAAGEACCLMQSCRLSLVQRLLWSDCNIRDNTTEPVAVACL